MKYMIRRESNQFDPKLIMYNVYEAHKYVPGKASGYRHGSIDLEVLPRRSAVWRAPWCALPGTPGVPGAG